MSEFRDPSWTDPAVPLRLWPGGPIDIERYRRSAHRIRALALRQAFRGLWAGLGGLGVRLREMPVQVRVGHE